MEEYDDSYRAFSLSIFNPIDTFDTGGHDFNYSHGGPQTLWPIDANDYLPREGDSSIECSQTSMSEDMPNLESEGSMTDSAGLSTLDVIGLSTPSQPSGPPGGPDDFEGQPDWPCVQDVRLNVM